MLPNFTTSLASSQANATVRRRRALIVEDEEAIRLILVTLLTLLDYETIEVDNGPDAIARFAPDQFDLVLMDLVMSGMDGLRTTQLIKGMCRDRFVPVLFVTAMTDEDTFSKCIAHGGDDVLHKPFDLEVLRSKVRALQRIRDLHDELGAKFFRLKCGEDYIEKLYKHAVAPTTALARGIAFETRSAERFNGDLFIHERGPNGELHLLLGDFAGRGLITAVAAVPTAEVFRSLVAQGIQPRDVAQQLNAKLFQLLPEQMFLAAVYIHIPLERGTINVINCGLPNVLSFDIKTGEVVQQIASCYLPLGVDNTSPEPYQADRLIVDENSGVFLCTDGLLDTLGSAHPNAIIVESLHAKSPFSITSNLLTQLGDGTAPPPDDISMLALHYHEVIEHLGQSAHRAESSTPIERQLDASMSAYSSNNFHYGMRFSGPMLKRMDPIALLVHPMHEVAELADQIGNIYTVLTELFVNALDHGVLGLSSSLKSEEEGFARYFELRDQRLAALNDGFVDIQMDVSFNNRHGGIAIEVTDSGQGFPYQNKPMGKTADENNGVAGRGTVLVHELCADVEYRGKGNEVHAVYRW